MYWQSLVPATQTGPPRCSERLADGSDPAAVRQEGAGTATHLTELEAARLHGFVDGAEVLMILVSEVWARGLGKTRIKFRQARLRGVADGAGLRSTLGWCSSRELRHDKFTPE